MNWRTHAWWHRLYSNCRYQSAILQDVEPSERYRTASPDFLSEDPALFTLLIPPVKRNSRWNSRLHGQRNETGLFLRSITASLLLASDHFDSLHKTLLKHRSMLGSYWWCVRFKRGLLHNNVCASKRQNKRFVNYGAAAISFDWEQTLKRVIHYLNLRSHRLSGTRIDYSIFSLSYGVI